MFNHPHNYFFRNISFCAFKNLLDAPQCTWACWYDVDHEALIGNKIFDKVQARFAKRLKFPPSKPEFDFSETMRCSECGSYIIAERKFKMLRKTGKKTMYVYHMCSRYMKRNCPQLPINEQVLIPQLVDLMDGINIDKFLLKREFEYELKRFHNMSDRLGEDSQKRS